MNSNHRTPSPVPTARCRAVAALLPLLDMPDTDAAASAEARAHLAGCAYCQAQRAAYRQLETAARRHLGTPAVPRYRAEEIMSNILRKIPAEPITEHIHGTLTPTPVPSHLREPGRPRRVLSGLASLAAVLVIAIIAASLFYGRAHLQPSVSSGFPLPVAGSTSILLDVAMVSANEGWAVGYRATWGVYRSDGTAISPSQETVLMMHYLQGTWSPVSLPIHGRLTGISMLSGTDGWATGYAGQQLTGIFLHYDGKTWRQIPAGQLGGYAFHQMQMLSDTDGWAVSGPVDHYDGHQWTAQPFPVSLENGTKNEVTMQGVSMTSPTSGWSVGFMQPILQGIVSATPVPEPPQVALPDGVIMLYAGGQWTVNQIIPGAELKSIVMTSPDEGWAVGRYDTMTTEQVNGQTMPMEHTTPLLLHYQHGAWTAVPDPLDDASGQDLVFEHITMLSDLDGWIIIGSGVQGGKSAALSYNGAEWQVARLPIKGLKNNDYAQINSISMTSSRDGWAVGLVASTNVKGLPTPNEDAVVPLLLHYQNNAWTIYNP